MSNITPTSENTPASGSDSSSEIETVPNPGLPPHTPRFSDVNEKSKKRNERLVAFFFILSMVGSIGFIVAYFYFPNNENTTVGELRLSNLCMGLAIACALLGIGIGIIQWARALMPDHEMIEERHDLVTEQEQKEAVGIINEIVDESGIKRRPLIRNTLLGALALAPIAAIFFLGDMDPRRNPVSVLAHSKWRRGAYLVKDGQGFGKDSRIKASDVAVGSAFHVLPSNLDPEAEENKEDHDFNFLNEKSKAIVLLMRLRKEDMEISPDRQDWNYNGIVAYSKVCTHVGCPIALYEHSTHHLLCPCHQSTFDVKQECKVIFGPAKRALPQLPITVDDDGYLVAQSDFHEPVGPSYWERLEGNKA